MIRFVDERGCEGGLPELHSVTDGSRGSRRNKIAENDDDIHRMKPAPDLLAHVVRCVRSAFGV